MKEILNEKETKKISKQLSYILRHHPDSIQISLDEEGWTDVETLLKNISKFNHLTISIEELKYVVETNNKKRFAFNEDDTKIRATQGHSVEVNLGYEATTPPDFLYHGTATRFLHSIEKEGLKKGSRHHVHLSKDKETALNVGSRHGVPVIIKVYASKMHKDGHEFFVSTNGVWLTEHIAPSYFEILH